MGMPIAESRRVRKRSSAPSRGRAGFTIVELLVTVAIVGIMAAAIAPSLTSARADGRQSDAALELVRLARFARARMLDTGTAQLLRFNASASGGLGRATVHGGMNNRCRHTPWSQALQGAWPMGAPGVRTGPGVLDMYVFNPTVIGSGNPKSGDVGRHVITLRVSQTPPSGNPTAYEEAYVCFEPSGRTYTALYSAAKADDVQPALQLQSWPVLFTIERRTGPNPEDKRGVDRHVVFPAGGAARVRL